MQDRIKQMAEEAGIDIDADTLCRFETWREPMIRFAQLVAEDCAKHCDSEGLHMTAIDIRARYGIKE